VQKPVGYWTYEYCAGVEVRQFHSFVRGVDRHSVTSLGRFDAAGTTSDGPQRFTGGDVCEQSNRRREATVNVGCGSSDRIVDVREPEACKYELAVELRAACAAAVAPGSESTATG
jgi:hypothetical protein